MKPILIVALAATLGGLGTPASAQGANPLVHLSQFGFYVEEAPRRVYRERRVYQDDDFYDRRPRQRFYEEEYSPRQRRAANFGQACVTSRGTCYVQPQPITSRCRCQIPGFGPKRGHVEY
jgi:hypothetical protein